MVDVRVIGGGLAGCEACYQLLKAGFKVTLIEMRPQVNTPVHKTGSLAELVCSNSLKSMDECSASGLLKRELTLLDSLIIKSALLARVPSGGSLSVDRESFSNIIERELISFPNFTKIVDEYINIDDTIPTIIATGPLTSDNLMDSLKSITGDSNLFFYDAVAPIVSAESIDMDKAFFMSRYNKGDADFLNCPLNYNEYIDFYEQLISAKRIPIKDYEEKVYEGCMPIEIMASRGVDTLRYGPMRPVGLYDKDNKRPYAVVQLRQENTAGSAYNIVGFQTNLTFSEQKRVISIIPALKNAEFLRYGVMHKNTYINSPKLLNNFYRLKDNANIYFAGQISGVEGYVESAMSGLIAAIGLTHSLKNKQLKPFPNDTICGSLSSYISNNANNNFQPMNANYGLLPPLDIRFSDKKEKKKAYYERSINCLKSYIDEYNI